MDVSIVVLNYNTCDHLRRCVEAVVREQSTTCSGRAVESEIFVVDNASSDRSADMIAAEFPAVHLIRAPRNGGFAYGNNLALGYALETPFLS
jgi:GT2 family glycosyltransferase